MQFSRTHFFFLRSFTNDAFRFLHVWKCCVGENVTDWHECGEVSSLGLFLYFVFRVCADMVKLFCIVRLEVLMAGNVKVMFIFCVFFDDISC